ncbi:hypothetical protein M3196_00030 [Fictibacillus nanhaiensis]|uniref:hypothetical protein n=1 Tax=Fictibacillus nanhaiensis TaxID=742169 RepID=UPI00203A58C3|nr:hypothetical protein [Fictibacillus nanhaiensis]MCM3730056.1 hypothetical protein [Fictibacillus nanhaiensis]
MERELIQELDGLKGYKAFPFGDYYRLVINHNELPILDIRVSGTAVANQSCGLDEDSIHQWLWDTGIVFIQKHKIDKFRIIMIKSIDVLNRQITTPIEQLYVHFGMETIEEIKGSFDLTKILANSKFNDPIQAINRQVKEHEEEVKRIARQLRRKDNI